MERCPLWSVLIGLVIVGCQSPDRPALPAPADSTQPHEVRPQVLPLSPDASRPALEFSGLTWHGDTLVVVPQYPTRAGGDDGPEVYGIARARLRQAVADTAAAPIEPFPIPLSTSDLPELAPGYEGFEALAFVDDRVHVLIEADATGAGMRGHLLLGRAAPGLQQLRLQPDTARSLPQQAQLRNMSYEALTTRGDTAIAISEANGRRVNDTPRAYRFDAASRSLRPVSFPTLEYRVTDATALDDQRRFWVINYFYPGDRDLLRPATDSLARRYGTGRTHRQSEVVERLVEYRYTPHGIRRTDTPPIWFELGEESRNWEGLVRFGNGFLVVTDAFPSTLLAYVPRPRDWQQDGTAEGP